MLKSVFLAQKGRGHLNYLDVNGKCVTKKILFLDLQLVDS